MNPRRLYRCRHDRPLAGVAAGMAEYLDLDPTVVRILWIIGAVFTGGLAILAYIVLAFVVPPEPLVGPAADPAAVGTAPAADGSTGWAAPVHQHHREGRGDGRLGLVIGVALVVFGAIALAGPLFPGWIGATALGPALVLAVGVALLVGSARRGDRETNRPSTES